MDVFDPITLNMEKGKDLYHFLMNNKAFMKRWNIFVNQYLGHYARTHSVNRKVDYLKAGEKWTKELLNMVAQDMPEERREIDEGYRRLLFVQCVALASLLDNTDSEYMHVCDEIVHWGVPCLIFGPYLASVVFEVNKDATETIERKGKTMDVVKEVADDIGGVFQMVASNIERTDRMAPELLAEGVSLLATLGIRVAAIDERDDED